MYVPFCPVFHITSCLITPTKNWYRLAKCWSGPKYQSSSPGKYPDHPDCAPTGEVTQKVILLQVSSSHILSFKYLDVFINYVYQSLKTTQQNMVVFDIGYIKTLNLYLFHSIVYMYDLLRFYSVQIQEPLCFFYILAKLRLGGNWSVVCSSSALSESLNRNHFTCFRLHTSPYNLFHSWSHKTNTRAWWWFSPVACVSLIFSKGKKLQW